MRQIGAICPTPFPVPMEPARFRPVDFLKLAICVPHTGSVRAPFAQCLANMIAHTLSIELNINGKRVTPRIETMFAGEGSLELKRTRLLLAARANGSDLTLMLDSDHTFPPDSFLTLLGRDRPLIGCNYPTRGKEARPTAMMLNRQLVPTTREKAEAKLVEEVVSIGLGFTLLRTALLDRVPAPWFQTEIAPNGDLECGEDVHFCNQARSAGIPVFVDHALSWRIGHLTELPVTLEDLAAR